MVSLNGLSSGRPDSPGLAKAYTRKEVSSIRILAVRHGSDPSVYRGRFAGRNGARAWLWPGSHRRMAAANTRRRQVRHQAGRSILSCRTRAIIPYSTRRSGRVYSAELLVFQREEMRHSENETDLGGNRLLSTCGKGTWPGSVAGNRTYGCARYPSS